MSDVTSAFSRPSSALDRAIARIEAEIPPKIRRYNILAVKDGARAFLAEPWRLYVFHVAPPLVRRLQAELVHRYWRRYA